MLLHPIALSLVFFKPCQKLLERDSDLVNVAETLSALKLSLTSSRSKWDKKRPVMLEEIRSYQAMLEKLNQDDVILADLRTR